MVIPNLTNQKPIGYIGIYARINLHKDYHTMVSSRLCDRGCLVTKKFTDKFIMIYKMKKQKQSDIVIKYI